MNSPKANRSAVLEDRRIAADRLSAEIAENRRKEMLAHAAKTARLRDQRLAKEAADARAASEAAASKAKPKRKRAP